MAIILSHRHFLVFPDGLVQELEWLPDELQVGDLISSEQVGSAIAPGGKYLIQRIVHEDPGEYPHHKQYHLTPF